METFNVKECLKDREKLQQMLNLRLWQFSILIRLLLLSAEVELTKHRLFMYGRVKREVTESFVFVLFLT